MRSDPAPASSLRISLWLVVAIVAAMLAFAPRAALAHEAHHHGAGPHASHASHAVTPSTEQAVAPRFFADAASHARQFCDRSTLLGDLVDCGLSCCFGMGCCSAAMVSAAPDVPPPPRDGLTESLPRLGHPSAGRASLLEPPNALA